MLIDIFSPAHGPERSAGIPPTTGPTAFRAPLALFVISLGLIGAVWHWLATPAALSGAPVDAARKLDCVSYAPFRMHQSPWNSSAIISPGLT